MELTWHSHMNTPMNTHMNRRMKAHMTRTFRFTTLIAATALAVGVGTATTAATAYAQPDRQQRIDTTFAFNKSGWLDVGAVSGTIIVTGWTKQEARIVARIETGWFESSLSTSRITLNTRSERSSSRRNNRMSEAHIEISVPIGTRVMASTTSGDMRIRGTAAEVQAHAISGNVEVVDAADVVEVGTVSGDIRLERVRARTRINTTSGDLALDGITGDLEIHSTSSDMVIRRVESSDVRIGTTSGDISYDGTIDPKGQYEISTHSGDVRFSVPSNIGATLSLQSYSGDIDSAFPMTLQPGQIRRQRGRRMEFVVGGGGARVSITTFSGDITIERVSARSPREE